MADKKVVLRLTQVNGLGLGRRGLIGPDGSGWASPDRARALVVPEAAGVVGTLPNPGLPLGILKDGLEFFLQEIGQEQQREWGGPRQRFGFVGRMAQQFLAPSVFGDSTIIVEDSPFQRPELGGVGTRRIACQ